MDETDRITGVFIDEEEEVQAQEGEEGSRSRVFAQLKPYCVELLELVENPKKHTPVIPAMLQFLGSSPSSALQHFFDYILFPLLLLLDASIDCRSPQKVDTEEKFVMPDFQKMPRKVSDYVAEGVLQCLEELLKKCHFRSVNQMVVVLKKLTYGALLPLSEASEEFREGVIKCFRALLLSLLPCSDKSCSCKQILGLPTLLESGSVETSLCTSTKNYSESEECLLAFLQSQTASTAVGHWLSLLLQAADTEAARGHRGSAKLRIEAFTTLRVLVAKVGSADALAFFLPGVVSKFAKVLHASKTMISGAGGSAEAINQAIRGFAEYLMIVLQDDANISSLDVSIDFVTDFNSSKHKSTQSFLEELRSLPDKAQEKIKIVAEDSSAEALKLGAPKAGVKEERSTIFGEGIGSLHVNRTKDWIEETSAHVNKLLAATFPHICVHPAKKVRQGLLAAIQGLLSKCIHTLKESRLMLLECLCVLVGDDSDEVSMAAQQFLNYLFSLSGKNYLERDVVEIFRRLIEKLPKMVLGREESLAISHAQQLLVVIYFSGPQLVVDHLLRSPPFQRYYRKARDLRVGHSVKWNEVLLADSLEASKTSVWKGSVTEPPVKKSAGSEKKSFLRKGFLNPPSRVVKDVGVGSLPSPPSCPPPVEGNGFSPSRNWPVGFDLNGELAVWEKDDDFWEGLPLDWEMDGVQDEESLAILDALEEDIHRDKMIARQKTKGKRELLNLKSSINYGDANTSSKRGKGKALMM